jgi:predicted dehydrogenase
MPESQVRTAKSGASTSPRLALIGCGAIAEGYYLPALAMQPHIRETLTLVDHDIARAQKLAAIFGVKRCLADYRVTLDDTDGVIIALPTHLHHPVSMEYLARGVHVLCEKPLAESAANAREMVEKARCTGAALAVNYLQRLYSSFVMVKGLLEQKTLGEPLSIKYTVGEEFTWPTVSGFYFNSPLACRGVLRDRGAHVLDHICWWLGGKPTLIDCQNDSFGGSDAVAHVRFKHDRCTGEIALSWLSSSPCRFMVECERGIIAGDIYDLQNLVITTRSGETKRVRLKSGAKSKSEAARQVVSNFLSVASEREQPLVSGREVLNSIEFIDECYASATRLDMPWYLIPETHDAQ